MCLSKVSVNRVLHNEACNAHDEIRRRRSTGGYLFPTLPCMRNGSFTPSTSIFKTKKQSRRYQMAGKEITPKLLLEAIRTLPEEKKDRYPAVLFRGHDRRGNRKDVQYVAQHDTVQTDKLF